MDKLLKEAIADAKAVRETAIANAKLALEEAFTPKLQSMLSAKIREDEEVDDEANVDEPEVDSAEEGDVYSAGEEDVVDAPADDAVVATGDEGEFETPAEEPTADDAELDEIIAELEAEMDDEAPVEEPVEENSKSSDIGKGDNKVVVADGDDEEKAETETSQGDNMGSEDENMEKVDDLKEGEGEDEDDDKDEPVDLEEIIRSLSEDQYTAGVDDTEAGDSVENPESPVDPTESKKLKEAYATIKFMKSKLNEVNLLNAKLLFANKLFRGNTLDEGQKLRVIETFDRASSVREVKLVYSTLSESLRYDAKIRKPSVKKITEGLASKSSRTTKPASKTVISEGTVMANRFKKLAGLIK